jgi:tetratricopeptide (TPR) repeat protein
MKRKYHNLRRRGSCENLADQAWHGRHACAAAWQAGLARVCRTALPLRQGFRKSRPILCGLLAAGVWTAATGAARAQEPDHADLRVELSRDRIFIGESLVANVYVTGVSRPPQDDVTLQVSASRDTVLIDEPFEIVFSVFIKKMQGDLAAVDPLNPAAPPRLEVPFLEPQPMAGLDGPDVRNLLRERLVQRRNAPAFILNNFTVRSDPFDSMFRMDADRARQARFMFERRSVERDGIPHYEYYIKLNYRPLEEGAYTFGPVVYKGEVALDIDPGPAMRTRSVFAVGPAQTVRVVPPPEENRPPSFIGAIGAYMHAAAQLDAQQCKIGDPLTLTLTVSGDITLHNAYPPTLPWPQEELSDRFRVYSDTVETRRQNDRLIFTYRLRPITVGTIEVPPLPVTYYDRQKRDYQTVWTRPVPLRVDESPQIGEADILGLIARDELEALNEHAALAPAPFRPQAAAGLQVRPLRPRLWHGAVAAGAPLLYAWVLYGQWRRRRKQSAHRRRRRRTALARARSALRAAEKIDDRAARDRAVCAAVRDYLRRRLDIAPLGLTPADARRELCAHGVPDEVATRLRDIFEGHFNAGYRGADRAAAPDRDMREVETVLHDIDAELHRRAAAPDGRAPGGKLALLALTLFPLVASARRPDDTERVFLWREASARVASAQEEADFERAAQSYRQLVRAGVRNGTLFYNLGSALLQSGRYEEAARALLRAERYRGGDPEIRRNLRLALAGDRDPQEVFLPWYRLFLFWHYGLGFDTRLAIATAAFAVFWLALTLTALGLRGRAPRLARGPALLLTALFASSVAASWLQERHDETRDRTPVLREEHEFENQT